MRIINSNNWSLQKSFTNVVVFSTDTDVVVLLLHYYNDFGRCGLKEIADTLGTGYDYLTKVGIKLAALKANPTQENPNQTILHLQTLVAVK